MDTKQFTRIQIKPTDLEELLSGAATHTHKKADDLPALNGVKLWVKDNRFTATATDRYRLIEGSLPVEDDGAIFEESLISLASVKKILDLLKGEKWHEAILTRREDKLTVTVRDNEITLPIVTWGQFPPTDHLFDNAESASEPDLSKGYSFNPSFFADYAKIVGKGQPVRIIPAAYGKPYKVILGGNKVSWRALLMPMKVSE